ncbi:hypothetical protein [Streptomyces sp. NPDC005805]|uniref:hypothetical protein n=1 Tax=Streptomyces sp. NPDC005805 TaxID=3157068 RepID=UPI0033C98C39
MRGLRGRGTDNGGDSGLSGRAGGTAAAVLAALALFSAGCSTGGSGVQDEGAAPSDTVAKATPSAAPSPDASRFTDAVDAVRLLKSDPKVSDRVKADLRPCARDSYPVDTSYGTLTGAGAPDVVVNVMTCGDAVGMGTYVYREDGKGYKNVFTAEEPSVYAAIDRGDLVVTRPVYASGDPVSEPSGEEVTTYRWAGDRFTQQYWVRNEYSRSVGEGDVLPSEAPDPADES